MGKNTAKRRAAKAKTQQRSRSANGPEPRRPQLAPHWDLFAEKPSGSPPPPQAEPQGLSDSAVHGLLLQLARSWHDHPDIPIQIARQLTGVDGHNLAQVERRAEVALLGQVEAIWQHGWQPAEVVRQGRRGCSSAAGGRLVALAIAVDHANRRANTLDHRWRAQVDSLDLPLVNGRPGWISCWAATEGLPVSAQLQAMVDALSNLLHLPRLDAILPPPGSCNATTAAARPQSARPESGAVASPVLARIRALLAKAESTPFEAEAEALIAKAQELMTRHAIDAALVHAHRGDSADGPEAIRVPVDAPYADAKALLLHVVAEASRCRAVWLSDLAMSEVVGLRDDLAAVEVLFTSLLVQAQAALAAAARHSASGSRVRSASFRSSFLIAFTHRINERFAEINETVLAEAEAELGSAFLPVLRSQSELLDEAVAERIGATSESSVRRPRDAAGWASGRQAADSACLARGDLDAPRAIGN